MNLQDFEISVEVEMIRWAEWLFVNDNNNYCCVKFMIKENLQEHANFWKAFWSWRVCLTYSKWLHDLFPT